MRQDKSLDICNYPFYKLPICDMIFPMDSKKRKSVSEISRQWNISERSVRNYCANGRVDGAILAGKTWLIPADAKKPERMTRHSKAGIKGISLLERMKIEKSQSLHGGIYHRIQIDLTYNSNHIEGSMLTHDQTRHIFETSAIGLTDIEVNVDDIVETVNHFRCVDLIIEKAKRKLTESFIKQLHGVLKSGTSDSRQAWFMTGGYKLLENEVGGKQTCKPAEVGLEMKKLLGDYESRLDVSFDDILDFHVRFERIHPFQDGNGRIGRLVMFKECLRHGIVPFIITDSLKLYYYRGLDRWDYEKGYLRDTCLTAQDSFKEILKGFGIPG